MLRPRAAERQPVPAKGKKKERLLARHQLCSQFLKEILNTGEELPWHVDFKKILGVPPASMSTVRASSVRSAAVRSPGHFSTVSDISLSGMQQFVQQHPDLDYSISVYRGWFGEATVVSPEYRNLWTKRVHFTMATGYCETPKNKAEREKTGDRLRYGLFNLASISEQKKFVPLTAVLTQGDEVLFVPKDVCPIGGGCFSVSSKDVTPAMKSVMSRSFCDMLSSRVSLKNTVHARDNNSWPRYIDAFKDTWMAGFYFKCNAKKTAWNAGSVTLRVSDGSTCFHATIVPSAAKVPKYVPGNRQEMAEMMDILDVFGDYGVDDEEEDAAVADTVASINTAAVVRAAAAVVAKDMATTAEQKKGKGKGKDGSAE